MVSDGGCFQSFGKLPQVERGRLGPYKVCNRTIMAVFLHLLGLLPQCKCIMMSLEVTLGQKWKRRAHVLHQWFLLSGPTSWKPQGQDVELLGLYCVAYLSLSLLSDLLFLFFTFKDLALCLWCSFPCSSGFYLTGRLLLD